MSEVEVTNTLLHEDLEKGVQYKFTVSEYKNLYYIGIRKYYLDFEGEFVPSKEGVTLPFTMSVVSNLFSAMVKLVSDVEKTEAFDKLIARSLRIDK